MRKNVLNVIYIVILSMIAMTLKFTQKGDQSRENNLSILHIIIIIIIINFQRIDCGILRLKTERDINKEKGEIYFCYARICIQVPLSAPLKFSPNITIEIYCFHICYVIVNLDANAQFSVTA